MPKRETIGDYLYWSYANLAMAHSAIDRGLAKYDQLTYIVRARLYKGLRTGTMKIGSLYDDERAKMMLEANCSYCGSSGPLSVDHLIPRHLGGMDAADNLVRACRPCNSSKQARDLLAWAATKGTFPPLLVLRRYLKLCIAHCEASGHLETRLDEPVPEFPFRLDLVPQSYPPLAELTLLAPRAQPSATSTSQSASTSQRPTAQ